MSRKVTVITNIKGQVAIGALIYKMRVRGTKFTTSYTLETGEIEMYFTMKSKWQIRKFKQYLQIMKLCGISGRVKESKT